MKARKDEGVAHARRPTRTVHVGDVAVGGNPVEVPDESTPDESAMVVDWIRVWERARPLPDPSAPESE